MMRCAAVVFVFTAAFAQDAQSILAKRCQPCHGAMQQQSGLRLDGRAAAVQGGYRGAAINPNNSRDSLLIRFVTQGVDGKKMPPAGPALSSAEVTTLAAWIDGGAPWKDMAVNESRAKRKHWAFEPLRRPALPGVRNQAWVRTPVDRFVLAKLEAEGIAPSPEADGQTLARRLHFDLIGLPPEPPRDVDELLRSPHFGERWALPWLDLAHYGDSDGHEQDHTRPFAWRYRDWVIRALNANMPFDRFTIEQLAGDLLPDATLDQRAAAGFLRCTLTSREGGIDLGLVRDEQVVDRVSTTGTVWLGLSLGCARCHDHKFDPVSQKDFYRLYAIFNRSREVNPDAPLDGEVEAHRASLPQYERRLLELVGPRVDEWLPLFEKRMREAREDASKHPVWRIVYETYRVWIDDADHILSLPPRKRTSKQRHQLVRFLVKSRPPVLWDELGIKDDPLRGVLAKLEQLDDSFPGISELPSMAEDPNPPRTHVLIRGDYKSPGIEVDPGLPASFTTARASNRLDLARWIVSSENPLPARVAVNRVWQELFGHGLVATSEDFGTRAEPPSHPELLDWLASEFVESGWNTKRLVRTIVDSTTYRQSSRVRSDLAMRDPENRLLARQNRLRLRSELLRDNALAVSGLLNRAVGGPSIRPPLPASMMQLAFRSRWKASTGADLYRRGLYIHLQRTMMFPQLTTFDTPDRLASCSRRSQSTNPLQALTLLNDPVFHEAAQALAARVDREAPGGLDRRIDLAFRLCLNRTPTTAERERLTRYHRDRSRDAGDEQANIGLASALLNLDEFITRE